METVFLRFPDEATFLASVPADNDGYPVLPNMVILGALSEGGQWDVDGNTIVEPTPLPGYHANTLMDACPPDLEQYRIYPATPQCVYFGVPFEKEDSYGDE